MGCSGTIKQSQMSTLEYSDDKAKQTEKCVLVQALWDNLRAGIPGASVAEKVEFYETERGKYYEIFVDKYTFNVAFNEQQMCIEFLFEQGGHSGEYVYRAVYYSVGDDLLRGSISVLESGSKWTMEGELASVKAAAERIVSELVEHELIVKA